MKLKTLLSSISTVAMLGLSSSASAAFDFGNPFDMWDDNDDYRYYDRGGRGSYGGDRWRRYDEWEPNYWRYRYFDNDSDDYFLDEFDGDFFGDGRGRFDFNMDMDSRFDNDYRNDFGNDDRYRGDRGYGDYGRPSRRSSQRDRYSNSDRYGNYNRYGSSDRYGNNDRYNDDYWRNYSQSFGSGNRRMSDTPERERRREERRAKQPVECR
jgi:hypothetical protein